MNGLPFFRRHWWWWQHWRRWKESAVSCCQRAAASAVESEQSNGMSNMLLGRNINCFSLLNNRYYNMRSGKKAQAKSQIKWHFHSGCVKYVDICIKQPRNSAFTWCSVRWNRKHQMTTCASVKYCYVHVIHCKWGFFSAAVIISPILYSIFFFSLCCRLNYHKFPSICEQIVCFFSFPQHNNAEINQHFFPFQCKNRWEINTLACISGSCLHTHFKFGER